MKKVRMEDITIRVRERRLKLGLSMNQLSKKCGLSIPCISWIERGISKNPGIFTILSLAEGLGMTLDELVYGEVKKR